MRCRGLATAACGRYVCRSSGGGGGGSSSCCCCYCYGRAYASKLLVDWGPHDGAPGFSRWAASELASRVGASRLSHRKTDRRQKDRALGHLVDCLTAVVAASLRISCIAKPDRTTADLSASLLQLQNWSTNGASFVEAPLDAGIERHGLLLVGNIHWKQRRRIPDDLSVTGHGVQQLG
jgi:hypothetical protein